MRLGVNVDHVATVRQARLGRTPDPIEAALICARAGADRIVCHLREDRRHMQDRDVARLARTLSIPLNLEMSMAPDVVAVALRLKPPQVTLVPERRRELTTEGGLDVIRLSTRLKPLLRRFQDHGIAVSLFVDPVAAQLEEAARLGAPIVELHTGRYATVTSARQRVRQLAILRRAAQHANRRGLAVAAGHGLNYQNTRAVVAIPEIEELNIGFSIIARALRVGLERAVREMKALLKREVVVRRIR